MKKSDCDKLANLRLKLVRAYRDTASADIFKLPGGTSSPNDRVATIQHEIGSHRRSCPNCTEVQEPEVAPKRAAATGFRLNPEPTRNAV